MEGILSFVFQGLRQSLAQTKKIHYHSLIIFLMLLPAANVTQKILEFTSLWDLFSCEANKNICTCLFSHLRTSGSFEIHSIPECYWMHFSHRAHPHPSITKIILIALRLQFVHAKRENEKLSTEWIKVKFLNYNNECTAFLVKSLSSAPLSKAKGLWRVL